MATPVIESALYSRNASTNAAFTYRNHLIVGNGLYYMTSVMKSGSTQSLTRVQKLVSYAGGNDHRLSIVQGTRRGRLAGLHLYQQSEISLGTHALKAPTPFLINVSGLDGDGLVVHWSLAAANERDQQEWLKALITAKDTLTANEQSGEAEQVRALCRKMKAGLKLRTRFFRFRLYHNCFSGEQAVTWLVQERQCSREEAVALGMHMFNLDLFRHISHEHLFLDGKLLYCYPDLSQKDRINYLAPFRALSKLHRVATQELSKEKIATSLLSLQLEELKWRGDETAALADALQRALRRRDLLLSAVQVGSLLIMAGYLHAFYNGDNDISLQRAGRQTARVDPGSGGTRGASTLAPAPILLAVLFFASLFSVFFGRVGLGGLFLAENRGTGERHKHSPWPEGRASGAIGVDINSELFHKNGRRHTLLGGMDSDDDGSQEEDEEEEDEALDLEGSYGTLSGGSSYSAFNKMHDRGEEGLEESDLDDWSAGEEEEEEEEEDEEEEEEDEEEEEKSTPAYGRETSSSTGSRSFTPCLLGVDKAGAEESETLPSRQPRSKANVDALRTALDDISQLPHTSSWHSRVIVRRSPSMVQKSDFCTLPQDDLVRMIQPLSHHVPLSGADGSSWTGGAASPAAAASLAELREDEIMSQANRITLNSDYFRGYAHLLIADLEDSPHAYFRRKDRRYLMCVQGKFKRTVPFSQLYTGQAFNTSIEALPSPPLVSASMKLLGGLQPGLCVNLSSDKPFILTPLMAAAQAVVITPATCEPPTLSTCIDQDLSDDLTPLGPEFEKMSSKKRRRYFGSRRRLKYVVDTECTYTFTFYSGLLDLAEFRAKLGPLRYDLSKVLGARPFQLSVVAWDPVESRKKKGKRARPKRWPFVWNLEVWNTRGIPESIKPYLYTEMAI